MRDRPPSVGTYTRKVGASLERVWENVRDWEHLPWQHASTFGDIECLDSGPWGWRARIRARSPEHAPTSLIELRIDAKANRYCVTTLDGPGRGNQIWTRLHEAGAHETEIEVDFCLAGVDADGSGAARGAETSETFETSRTSEAKAAFEAFRGVYARLWDEDEEMMQRRERLLGEKRGEPRHAAKATRSPVDLGPVEAFRRTLPRVTRWAGRSFRIIEDRGEFLAHATVCPHALGPLEDAPIESGRIRCPWHGYEFDLRRRECLPPRSAAGPGPTGEAAQTAQAARLRLPSAPRLRVDAETRHVILEAPNTT